MSSENYQYMKPYGDEGIKIIEEMNEHHKDITEFALDCIDIDDNDKIIDLGCGGGANIEKFLKLTKNNVDGLDYSEVSVSQSIKKNQEAIDNNRCEIIQADVSNIPIADGQYDLASAFETIYFWPNIENAFKEVSRIIKPNGRFMIAQETDGNNPEDETWIHKVEGIRVYTAPELKEYLLNAGVKSVESFKKEGDYILVVIAQK